jgi:diguanylate cyclase (GGDEF)-like protein
MHPPKASSAHILVIDDQPTSLEVIAEYLTLHGYSVTCAQDGFQGLAAAKKHPPDLILCDIIMPGMDGYQLLETLQQDEQLHAIPFIFISALAVNVSDIRKGMSSGADDYLLKPFSMQELLQAVRTRLKRKGSLTATYRRQLDHTQQELQMQRRLNEHTGLPNYQALCHALQTHLHHKQKLAVLVVDLDRFKRMNDAFGLQRANVILKCMIDRLEQITHHYGCQLYSYEGDQMVVLSTTHLTPKVLRPLAHAMMKAISETLIFGEYELHLTCSIGVYCSQRSDSEPDQLTRKAYRAMNQAKIEGGAQAVFYRPEMDALASRRLIIEGELYRALERNQLQLYYQPQFDLQTSKLCGFEALLRWKHPELGLVMPGEFIPIAEETDLIVPVGLWILETAVRQLRDWQYHGIQDLTMAVNVSALQLREGSLVGAVQRVLKDTQVAAHCLELELTESLLVRDLDQAVNDLKQLKQAWVTLAMDDFGTGYSSLSYLKRFPLDNLKIDQSFIRSMGEDSQSTAIPKALIEMGQHLSLHITAEGIETRRQYQQLKAFGCHRGQGYYLGRPVPPSDAEEFCRAS